MHPFFFFFLFSIEKGESVLTKIKIYTINEMMGAEPLTAPNRGRRQHYRCFFLKPRAHHPAGAPKQDKLFFYINIANHLLFGPNATNLVLQKQEKWIIWTQ